MFGAYEEGTKNIIDARDAVKGKNYVCPECGNPVVFKPGHGFKRRHYACKGGEACEKGRHDGPSKWHTDHQYNIKNPVSNVNIEVVIKGTEYRKRADQLLPSGYVVEYQRSPINIDERKLRETVYSGRTRKPLLWYIHDEICASNAFIDLGNKEKPSTSAIVFRERKGGNLIGVGWGPYEIVITKDDWINIIVNNPHIRVLEFIRRRAMKGGVKRLHAIEKVGLAYDAARSWKFELMRAEDGLFYAKLVYIAPMDYELSRPKIIEQAWSKYQVFEINQRYDEITQYRREMRLKELRIAEEKQRKENWDMWDTGFARWIPKGEITIHDGHRLYPENHTRFNYTRPEPRDIYKEYRKSLQERDARNKNAMSRGRMNGIDYVHCGEKDHPITKKIKERMLFGEVIKPKPLIKNKQMASDQQNIG